MNIELMVMGEDEILEEVDEYLLYCLYLGFPPELRVRYTSPVREKGNEDSHASWSMFYNTSCLAREFAWKDGGTGIVGDIFKLVQLRCGLKNKYQAIERVKRDVMHPDGQKVLLQAATIQVKSASPAQIRVKSRDFDSDDLQWWKLRTSGTEEVLRKFNTSRVKYYWIKPEQEAASFPGDRTYATRIYDHYQLYFPFRDKDRRWRNDLNDNHLPGFCQLAHRSDTVIITKPMKEIICCTMAGFEAVGARGEHTLVPDNFMIRLKREYRYVFTLFDNDGKHHGWRYNCPSIEIPLCTNQKDLTDFHFAYGLKETIHLLDSLIKNHPTMEIDPNKPMTRREWEEFLDKHYKNKVISIQHVGKKITLVCGKVHQLAVENMDTDPICIAMINDTRYEFGLGYFIQKAQIQEYNVNK